MKKIFFSIGFVMLISAIMFIIFACNHPEGFFRMSIRNTSILYIFYLIIMIIMFLLAFVSKSKHNKK